MRAKMSIRNLSKHGDPSRGVHTPVTLNEHRVVPHSSLVVKHATLCSQQNFCQHTSGCKRDQGNTL
jgi:hypothetical protein